MDEYKNYERLDASGNVILAFSSAFVEPQEGDICVNENGGRHYNPILTNEQGQYLFHYVNGVRLEKTAEELFDLQAYKLKKIEEMNTLCQSTIIGTFTSSAMGAAHTYAFDYEAQINLAGVKQAFQDGLITQIEWNTRDAGAIFHNQAQFSQLWLDGFIHKNTNMIKYRTLKAQKESATNQQEVDAVLW